MSLCPYAMKKGYTIIEDDCKCHLDILEKLHFYSPNPVQTSSKECSKEHTNMIFDLIQASTCVVLVNAKTSQRKANFPTPKLQAFMINGRLYQRLNVDWIK